MRQSLPNASAVTGLILDLTRHSGMVYARRDTAISLEFQPVLEQTMKHLDVPKSGSIDSKTYSRNRFGQYVRSRAIPVNPNTVKQSQMRARFGDNSQAWRSLTSDKRAGWASLGNQVQRTDALGQTYSLTGQQAHIMVNNNLLDAGVAIVTDAPGVVSPVGLITATVTTTGGTLSVAYTATPLSAANYLYIHASPQRSAGRAFEGDLRLIAVTAAAAASPHNLLAAYTARFGAPVVGNKIFFSLQVGTLGFLSAPLLTSVVVAA